MLTNGTFLDFFFLTLIFNLKADASANTNWGKKWGRLIQNYPILLKPKLLWSADLKWIRSYQHFWCEDRDCNLFYEPFKNLSACFWRRRALRSSLHTAAQAGWPPDTSQAYSLHTAERRSAGAREPEMDVCLVWKGPQCDRPTKPHRRLTPEPGMTSQLTELLANSS